MKTIKYALILIMTFTTLISCVEDDDLTHLNDDGPNLGGFSKSAMTLGGIANGDEYLFDIQMEVKGPTYTSINGDVLVSIDVAPGSTAIEGTHFRFDSKSILLPKDNNFLGLLPITMLTQGIVAPLEMSPILKLKVTNADGVNVLGNGKLLTITLNYLCFSNLAQTYNVDLHYINPSAGIDAWYNFNDTFTETGIGEYRTENVGHWTQAQLGGTPGFTFFDVCNGITIPEQNLVDLYSNLVEGVPNASSVDPVTGVIYMEYLICAGGACREYYVTYTPL
ncbi:MAG: hypothetical protein QM478_06010 [Flavobacteriaceae bacterium]